MVGYCVVVWCVVLVCWPTPRVGQSAMTAVAVTALIGWVAATADAVVTVASTVAECLPADGQTAKWEGHARGPACIHREWHLALVGIGACMRACVQCSCSYGFLSKSSYRTHSTLEGLACATAHQSIVWENQSLVPPERRGAA